MIGKKSQKMIQPTNALHCRHSKFSLHYTIPQFYHQKISSFYLFKTSPDLFCVFYLHSCRTTALLWRQQSLCMRYWNCSGLPFSEKLWFFKDSSTNWALPNSKLLTLSFFNHKFRPNKSQKPLIELVGFKAKIVIYFSTTNFHDFMMGQMRIEFSLNFSNIFNLQLPNCKHSHHNFRQLLPYFSIFRHKSLWT